MKADSFAEILEEAMTRQAGPTSESPPAETFISWNADWFHFEVTVRPATQQALKSYPRPSQPKPAEQEVATPTPPPEKQLRKSDLGEAEQSKWNLFEKTFQGHFGDQVTRREALSTFRRFVRQVHPDLQPEARPYDFATLVRIKNEFIAVLDESLP